MNEEFEVDFITPAGWDAVHKADELFKSTQLSVDEVAAELGLTTLELRVLMALASAFEDADRNDHEAS